MYIFSYQNNKVATTSRMASEWGTRAGESDDSLSYASSSPSFNGIVVFVVGKDDAVVFVLIGALVVNETFDLESPSSASVAAG